MASEPVVKCQAPGGASEGHVCTCDVALETEHEVHVCRCGAEWAVLHEKPKPDPMPRTLMGDLEAVLNGAARKIQRDSLRQEMLVAHIESLTGCSHEVAHAAIEASFEVFHGEAVDRDLTLSQYMAKIGQDEKWVIIGMCVGRLSAQLEP